MEVLVELVGLNLALPHVPNKARCKHSLCTPLRLGTLLSTLFRYGRPSLLDSDKVDAMSYGF